MYSDLVKETLFSLNFKYPEKIYEKEASAAPGSLTAQFTCRISRQEVIQQISAKETIKMALFPSLEAQQQLFDEQNTGSSQQTTVGNLTRPAKKRKSPF